MPRVTLCFASNGRFGLTTAGGSADDPVANNKKLTFSPGGSTNNTRVMVDGQTPLFGEEGQVLASNIASAEGPYETDWEYGGIRATQRVELVAGEVSRRLDTVRVTFRLKNTTAEPHEAGLRVMIDTLIGDNDGVPFIVPGVKGIVTDSVTYEQKQVPDFVRALEREDLVNPGVIVNIGLRTGEGERPSRVVLSHWPGGGAEWDYPIGPIGSDSAIGLYYEARRMAAGQTRTMQFTYGLGTISSTTTKNAKLSLTAGGPFRAGGTFWLVALVVNPKPGQTLRLTLPEGLSLDNNEHIEKAVATDNAYTSVSWLIHLAPTCAGQAKVGVTLLPDGVTEQQTLVVQSSGERLRLTASAPVLAGKPFWVTAVVRYPQAGQQLTLELPADMALGQNETATKPLPAGEHYVRWLVHAGQEAPKTTTLRAKLRPGDAEASCSVDVQFGTLIQ